nr:DNA replication complex GINS protein SLD5-like [Ipomoea batatas]GMD84688.1 DNA replication complex GINS protein SLD5-like [Ipomoea batatas]
MDLGSGEGGSGLPTTDDLESLISTTDAELLKPAWRNEKGAPQILQFEDALIHRSREQIQLMEETVEEYTKTGVDPLTASLYRMDLDRTMFLLRSYLRTRLQKVTMNHLFWCKRFLEAFQLDDSWEDPVSIEADDLYAFPYRPLVENGQIDIV